MDVQFESSFEKDLKRNRDKKLLGQIKQVVLACKAAETLLDIRNIKPLKGFSGYYRIRLGNYRVGIEVINDIVIFVRFLHRKDLYRYFP